MKPISCQSLGNKFFLFDGQNGPETSWPALAKKLCAEHHLDGILVLTAPKITMFNADGSNGQLCLNGARCVAHYLYTKHKYPKQFELTMGEKTIAHTIKLDRNKINITQKIPLGAYLGQKKITSKAGVFTGHVINVGNPHFIIFEKKDREWLEQHGRSIEQHEEFPNKTNVEFVWQDETEPNTYHLLVYERGCGVTQACSSGAAAVTQLLYEKKRARINEPVKICMLGGDLTGWITPTQQIALSVTYS